MYTQIERSESPIIQDSYGARKSKGLNRIAVVYANKN